MASLKYRLEVHDARTQELIAEGLELAVTQGLYRGPQLADAKRLIRKIVGLMLARKTIEPDEADRVRERWSIYLKRVS